MAKRIDWSKTLAAVWRPNKAKLKAISQLDDISLKTLIGIDRQKKALVENTERFLNAKPSNNALLWGSRGTGKSSLIKATFNQYREQNLRIIEVFKEDLHFLPDIVDQIRNENYYFIIYCDDFAFIAGDHSYSGFSSNNEREP